MSSKLSKSRILYKGFLKTNTSKIRAPVKISFNLLENIVNGRGSFEKEALENEDRSTKHPKLENEAPKRKGSSSRIYEQSQAHDEIDRSIYTTKSVTKETIADSLVFLDGCDQFEDKFILCCTVHQ